MNKLAKRMVDKEFISKLELLKTMHISCGQLYSWKRKGLIPQEWFVKQVTRTGQITVFPRNLIETRIRDILRYKEKYSLDKVEKLISPELTGDVFSLAVVKQIKEINLEVLDKDKESYTYVEILILIVISDFVRRVNATQKEIKNILKSLSKLNFRVEKDIIFFIEYKGEYFTIITVDKTVLFPSKEFKTIGIYSLCEVSESFKENYESIINIDREDIVNEAIEEIVSELGGL